MNLVRNFLNKIRYRSPIFWLYTVSFDFEAWPWPSRPKASSQKCSRMVVMIRNRVGGDFCEDAFGRDGHGHAWKSKETLSFNLKIWFRNFCELEKKFSKKNFIFVVIYFLKNFLISQNKNFFLKYYRKTLYLVPRMETNFSKLFIRGINCIKRVY